MGWRRYPQDEHLLLTPDSRTFLLIRDPRDMATSLYFSLRFSHTTAGVAGPSVEASRSRLQSIEIDSYVLGQAPVLLARFREYAPLQKTNLMLRRYEDIIFDKQAFLADLCRHFEIDLKRPVLARLVKTIDKQPETENIHAHVRQVAPGDHRRKLKPETIEKMNAILSEVLTAYDYPFVEEVKAEEQGVG